MPLWKAGLHAKKREQLLGDLTGGRPQQAMYLSLQTPEERRPYIYYRTASPFLQTQTSKAITPNLVT